MTGTTLVGIPNAVLVAELERRGYKIIPPQPATATLDDFRPALFAALDHLDAANRRLGLVPIPAVRRALAGRVHRGCGPGLVLDPVGDVRTGRRAKGADD